MDALSMPLLMDWQKAEDAFAILRSSKRSAVVVRDNLAKYWLAWASDIDDARRTPVAALASIKNRDPIYAAQMTDHKQYGIDFVHPGTTADQYHVLLDKTGTDYELINETGDSVVIVTRHETLRAALGSTTLECEGPGKHVYPKPQKSIGDDCPRCPADATGRRPKIRLAP